MKIGNHVYYIGGGRLNLHPNLCVTCVLPSGLIFVNDRGPYEQKLFVKARETPQKLKEESKEMNSDQEEYTFLISGKVHQEVIKGKLAEEPTTFKCTKVMAPTKASLTMNLTEEEAKLLKERWTEAWAEAWTDASRFSALNPHLASFAKDAIVEEDEDKEAAKYDRVVYDKYTGQACVVDVYRVLEGFGIHCSAMAHGIKKCLAAGERGAKDTLQDKQEAIKSIQESIQLDKNRM